MSPIVYFFFLTFFADTKVRDVFQILRSMDTFSTCREVQGVCEHCQELVTILQKEIAEPEIQKEIMTMFEFICKTQKTPLDEICLEVMHDFIPKLIDELLSLDSYTICRSLWVC